MIAPTHIAFGLVCGMVAGVDNKTSLAILAGGALLPDIDHPLSAIGRVLFPISIPLNKAFGHRGFVHSLVLWVPLTCLGYFWPPLYLIGGGAISHCIIDTWTLSGLPMFTPITEKIFVLAKRAYRIATGSRAEMIFLAFLVFLTLAIGHVSSRGGFRAMMLSLMGNYQMAVEAYQREGTTVCNMEGKLRFPDGEIEEKKWLIIGGVGSGGLTIYDAEKQQAIQVPAQATFLKAVLKKTDQKWSTLKISTPTELKAGSGFCRAKDKWRAVQAGEMLIGYFIYSGQIELGPPL